MAQAANANIMHFQHAIEPGGEKKRREVCETHIEQIVYAFFCFFA